MSAFHLSKVSNTIVDSLSKPESFSEKEFCHIDRLMVNEWCDRKIVSELIAAKNEIGKNFKIYNRYRDIIIPRHTEYNGFTSKYHTFIKLMQAFELGEVETNFKSFYDLCFAPGAFSEGLFRCFDIERGYGITLIPSRSKGSRTALRIDEDIVSNPKFKIISPKCGNLYLENSYLLSRVQLNDFGNVDLVCGDGGIDIKGMDDNLQSLISYHLIFCECLYALSFLNENGTFVCKLFDCFDDLTAQLLMAMTLFFDEVIITKPDESRAVNSERYLVCKRFHLSENNIGVRDHMLDLMCISEHSIPGPIFTLESRGVQRELYEDFAASLRVANETIAVQQTKAIKKTLFICKTLNSSERR